MRLVSVCDNFYGALSYVYCYFSEPLLVHVCFVVIIKYYYMVDDVNGARVVVRCRNYVKYCSCRIFQRMSYEYRRKLSLF